MARPERSLQQRIRERQQSAFVGRQEHVVQYQENLRLPVDDERRRFLFNIYGDAGVGKTFLSRQLEQLAGNSGAVTAYIDEAAQDVVAALTAVAAGFARSGCRLGEFEKRAADYLRRRHELESDPQAPDGAVALITRTAVTIGLAAVRDIPVAGSLLAPVDPASATDLVNRTREYLARRFSDYRDVRLLLSPAEELTPLLAAGMNRVAPGRAIALFVDAYERTGLLLDQWLRSLYAGRYGDLPETLVTTISGQKPLDPNVWGEYLPVMTNVSLEPFSEAEARQFLASKHITDEPTAQVIISLSGRLPLWLATLAAARQQGSADIGNPTGDVVERFLKWEDDAVRRDIAIAAALPRTVNQDVLTVIVPAGRARELFGWLREMPFVSPRGDSWAYHDVVRTAMLRWQRAAAPAEWRSVHNLLAAANAGWARQVVAGTSSAWTSPECIDYLREETYHLLCANPHGNLHWALTSAVRAAEHGAIRARQWAALLADAGRDSGNDQLKVWGQRLADGIRGGDLSSYLTCLIDDGSLDTSALVAALEQRGEAHRLAGRFGEALTDLTRAIQADPGRASAIASRGETYRALRRNDEALADFNRAIELNPGYAWAIGSRGQIYRVTRRYDDAIGDFDRAIELNPNYVWGIGSRGQTYHDMRRYDDAVADFSRAIELNPNYVWGIGSRGQTYRDMGRFDDALADFNRAIELKPWHAWTIASRGETYRLMGRYDEALRDLNHVIEHDPADVWAIGHRGQAYQAMGRYEEALRDLNRAIELDPELDWAIVSRDEIFSAIDDGATPG